MKHDTKSILKAFKRFYSNLAGNLFAKLPKLPNRYTINFVSDYCKKLIFFKKFKLDSTTEDCLFNKLLKNFEVTKAAGIGQFAAKFWQNLLVSYATFQ